MQAQNKTALSLQKNRVPAEWERHAALWTAWPSHPDLWPGSLLHQAREEIAAMIRLMADGEPVKVLAMGAESIASAKAALGSAAEVYPAEFGDIWLRDTGPIFARTPDGMRALRFLTNGWGGEFLYPFDDVVGDTLARLSGHKIRYNSFILEGGALEHDGAGTILTTRQCLLNPNRNEGWSQEDAESALKDAFGAHRILWLEEGLLNDHTDGHIDNLARFVAPGRVVCPEAFGNDDPNARLYDTVAADLAGMGLDVVRVPSPGLVRDDAGAITPASHMNFIIGNEAVAVPVYGTPSQDKAVAILADLFPGRRVVGLPSNAVLTGGGSFHCITQQEPEDT